MSKELRSALVWALYFLALELPAHFQPPRWALAISLGGAVAFAVWAYPILTLSGTVWGGEEWWHPLAAAVIVFLAVLAFHFVNHISASWLIAVAFSIAVAVGLHFLVTRTAS